MGFQYYCVQWVFAIVLRIDSDAAGEKIESGLLCSSPPDHLGDGGGFGDFGGGGFLAAGAAGGLGRISVH
jgi:hypothetical protein